MKSTAPFSGPLSGPSFWAHQSWFLSRQVLISNGSMWQWMMRLCVVRPFCWTWTKLHCEACQWRTWHCCQSNFENPNVTIDRASLSDRRSSISLLASYHERCQHPSSVAHRSSLAINHTLTLQVLRFIGERIGSVSLSRQKSASNSHSTMPRWLALLVKALGHALRKVWLDKKSKAANGAISTEAWLQTVCNAIEKVIGWERLGAKLCLQMVFYTSN